MAKNGNDVTSILKDLSTRKAHEIGQAAYRKVLSAHTYNHRAELLQSIFNQTATKEVEAQ